MSDATLAIVAIVISGLTIILSGWTIYMARQTAKVIKRIREGGRP